MPNNKPDPSPKEKPTDQKPKDEKRKPIDFKNKDARAKEKHVKVEAWIQSAYEDTQTQQVNIIAYTPRRAAMGLPPMEIINPNLEAALDDIATLTRTKE